MTAVRTQEEMIRNKEEGKRLFFKFLRQRLKEHYQTQKFIHNPLYPNLESREIKKEYIELEFTDHNLKQKMDVARLFEQMTKTPEIEVIGQAGSGKSTFCLYLVQRWAQGHVNCPWVFWIPLRTLWNYDANDKNLDSLTALVFKECFKIDIHVYDENLGATYFISLREWRSVLEEFWREGIRHAKKVVIFDGLDELAPHLKSKFSTLLCNDWGQTNQLIITTRPSSQALLNNDQSAYHSSTRKRFYLNGFNVSTIYTYISHFCAANNSTLLSNQEVELKRLFRSNYVLEELGRIPINLELICSVWYKERGQLGKNTFAAINITFVYEKILQHILSNVADLSVQLNKIIPALEALAFAALKENKIVFTLDFIDRVAGLKQFIKPLLQCGLLREVDQSFCFIHLTLQEFLAARSMVRVLSSIHTHAKHVASWDWFSAHMFLPRLEITSCFVAGMLPSPLQTERGNFALFRANATFQEFFGVFQEQEDLVGWRSLHLEARCVNEAYTICTPIQKQITLKKLIFWIKHILGLSGGTLVARSLLTQRLVAIFKLNQTLCCDKHITALFIHGINNPDPGIKHKTYAFLVQSGVRGQDLIHTLLQQYANETETYQAMILEAFSQIPTLQSDVLQLFFSQLRYGTTQNKILAAAALVNMGLTENIENIEAELLAAYENNTEIAIKRLATQGLSQLKVLSPSAFATCLKAREYPDRVISDNAVKMLTRVEKDEQQAEQVLHLFLKHRNFVPKREDETNVEVEADDDIDAVKIEQLEKAFRKNLTVALHQISALSLDAHQIALVTSAIKHACSEPTVFHHCLELIDKKHVTQEYLIKAVLQLENYQYKEQIERLALKVLQGDLKVSAVCIESVITVSAKFYDNDAIYKLFSTNLKSNMFTQCITEAVAANSSITKIMRDLDYDELESQHWTVMLKGISMLELLHLAISPTKQFEKWLPFIFHQALERHAAIFVTNTSVKLIDENGEQQIALPEHISRERFTVGMQRMQKKFLTEQIAEPSVRLSYSPTRFS